MFNNMIVRDGCIGFGLTAREAEIDLSTNKYKSSGIIEQSSKFMERRNFLNPWMPTEEVLHITGIGCLVYDKIESRIVETKSERSISVLYKGSSIYYYVLSMFGELLSYVDITIILRPELEAFFSHISNEITRINQMPLIRVIESGREFKPYAIYAYEKGIYVGISDTAVGMKYTGSGAYYVVEGNFTEIFPILSYIACRMGVVFTERGVFFYGEEAREF